MTLCFLVIDMTDGKVSDVKMAQKTIEQLPSASIIVMDRGYNDYSLFNWMSERDTRFVTRLKTSSVYEKTELVEKNEDSDGIWIDRKIRFTSEGAKNTCGQRTFRLVKWYDKDREEWMRFLTNDFDSSAPDIATLYRERWQIELFFKKLKQNLKIKSFLGTSENAVLCQIWTAAIATLLIELIKRRSTYRWSFSRLVTFIRLNLLTFKTLDYWCNHPDFRSKPTDSAPQQLVLFST